MSEVVVAGAELALSIEAQWRRWLKRYTWHLDQVPGLLDAMRADVVPLGAVSYDRVRVDVSREGAPVPFRVEAVDAIDDLWAALVEYADNVAELLGATLPVVTRWQRGSGVMGARSSADLRGDSFALVAWLVERAEAVVPLQELGASEDHLFSLIRSGSKRYLEARPERGRRCPVCGQGRMTVRFTRTQEIWECVRCLEQRERLVGPPTSAPCAEGAHERCSSIQCLCSCHVRSSSLYSPRKRTVPAPVVPLSTRPASETCDHAEWRGYRGDDDLWHCGGCGVVL